MAHQTGGMSLHSQVFSHNGPLPSKYSCQGEDINPPLSIQHIPEGTLTLALIMEDPDAPGGMFDHWIVWNISPRETIGEATNPGISGTNDFGKTGYGGPCPPSGQHRYYFRIYALDAKLDLPAGSRKKDLLRAMEGHVLAEAEMIGLFRKAAARSTM